MLSTRGSLSLFVSEAIIADQDRKGVVITPNVTLAFLGLSGGEVLGTVVFAFFVHLFGIRIVFCFLGLGLICERR